MRTRSPRSLESLTPASELANENLISEIAAVSGISTNFSSGDNGDFTNFGIPATVSAPRGFAVGYGRRRCHSGAEFRQLHCVAGGMGQQRNSAGRDWGCVRSASCLWFYRWSGWWTQQLRDAGFERKLHCRFPKTSYQKKLPGKTRQVPDISWLADPFTGAVIAITVPGSIPALQYQVWGGTSVACPMFSALWAIANQEAGAPLGQAAPYLYSLPAGAVTDVVPVGLKNNVTASIQESSTLTNKYNANQVLGGTASGKFGSALWDYPSLQDTALVISFGTDCDTLGLFSTPCTTSSALHTKVGWDNVTGVGTPNAQAFADSFHPAPKK